jgi:hypothetical protein
MYLASRWPPERMREISASELAPSIGFLAGGVDRRQDDAVGIVEAIGKILEEARQTRVTMRLVHRDDAALARFAGCPQHGLDLHRMVAVVVEDRNAVPGRPSA